MDTSVAFKDLTEKILGSCFDVMHDLGVGFLENVYKNALVVTLQERGIPVKQEVPIQITYKKNVIGFYKADILVDEKVIVELKCCKVLLPEH